MKIVRDNNLERQDATFRYDKEPELRYRRRQITMQNDEYDCIINDTEDITTVENWLSNYKRLRITRNKAIEYATDKVGVWESAKQSDKDLIMAFACETHIPILSTEQITDLTPMIECGFSVFENGGVDISKKWNGTAWV